MLVSTAFAAGGCAPGGCAPGGCAPTLPPSSATGSAASGSAGLDFLATCESKAAIPSHPIPSLADFKLFLLRLITSRRAASSCAGLNDASGTDVTTAFVAGRTGDAAAAAAVAAAALGAAVVGCSEGDRSASVTTNCTMIPKRMMSTVAVCPRLVCSASEAPILARRSVMQGRRSAVGMVATTGTLDEPTDVSTARVIMSRDTSKSGVQRSLIAAVPPRAGMVTLRAQSPRIRMPLWPHAWPLRLAPVVTMGTSPLLTIVNFRVSLRGVSLHRLVASPLLSCRACRAAYLAMSLSQGKSDAAASKCRTGCENSSAPLVAVPYTKISSSNE